MTRPVTLTAVVTLALLAGYGNADATSSSNATSTTHAAASHAPTPAELRDGVVAALHANHKLAVSVLWTNQVPATASRSTRGPALSGLRASARDRQQQHLRVRMLHDSYRIISIRLSPSQAIANAVVQWNQDVAPSNLNGTRRGRAIELHERAQIVLHRIGASRRFVVWRVNLLP